MIGKLRSKQAVMSDVDECHSGKTKCLLWILQNEVISGLNKNIFIKMKEEVEGRFY